MKKNEMSLETIQKGLESIMLSVVSQTDRQIDHFTHMWNLKKTSRTNKLVDIQNRCWLPEEKGEEGGGQNR